MDANVNLTRVTHTHVIVQTLWTLSHLPRTINIVCPGHPALPCLILKVDHFISEIPSGDLGYINLGCAQWFGSFFFYFFIIGQSNCQIWFDYFNNCYITCYITVTVLRDIRVVFSPHSNLILNILSSTIKCVFLFERFYSIEFLYIVQKHEQKES